MYGKIFEDFLYEEKIEIKKEFKGMKKLGLLAFYKLPKILILIIYFFLSVYLFKFVYGAVPLIYYFIKGEIVIKGGNIFGQSELIEKIENQLKISEELFKGAQGTFVFILICVFLIIILYKKFQKYRKIINSISDRKVIKHIKKHKKALYDYEKNQEVLKNICEVSNKKIISLKKGFDFGIMIALASLVVAAFETIVSKNIKLDEKLLFFVMTIIIIVIIMILFINLYIKAGLKNNYELSIAEAFNNKVEELYYDYGNRAKLFFEYLYEYPILKETKIYKNNIKKDSLKISKYKIIPLEERIEKIRNGKS